MILLDSNILIYSGDEKYRHLRELFKQTETLVSILTKLEVLGYHKIGEKQVAYFESVFKAIDVITISDEIIDQAILYRRQKSMSVGDSIIAASAKLFHCDLYTNNVSDFKHINDFKIINPIDF